MASAGKEPIRNPKKRSSRRTVAEMRAEVRGLGGVFLDFSRRARDDGDGRKTARHEWHAVEEKGFRVFSTGCILPHPYYTRKGKDGPARVRGPRASINAFGDAPAAASARNADGWPEAPEVSHLCHWPACVNPDHLRWEPRWKNWKRNYCRGCDCNADEGFPCLQRFHPSAWWQDEANWPEALGYDAEEALRKVLPRRVVLLPRTHFDVEDRKRANQRRRRKRGHKHDAEAAKRASKGLKRARRSAGADD